MISLLDNPFAVLRLSSSSSTSAVADRAREIGTPAASAARDALIAPRLRLDAEIAFLPGASAREVGAVLDALGAGRAPALNELTALARANVLAHLAALGPRTTTVLRELAEAQAHLSQDVILAVIKRDRARAGMPPPNSTLFDTNIDAQRDTHASALAAGAFALGEEAGSRVLRDLIRSADPPRLAFLRRAAAAWERATASAGAKLLEDAAGQEVVLAHHASPTTSERLAGFIRNWADLTAPQRLMDACAGLAHAPSLDAARRWRALGVDLANERDAPAAALPIAEALAAGFGDLPELGHQLAADVKACRSLTEAAAESESLEIRALEAAIEQAERGRDVLRRELTGKHPLNRGPKVVTDLLTAFLAAAARATGELPWVLVRGFALKLHNEYDIPGAALSLTLMMLDCPQTGLGNVSPALLQRLEEDQRTLRQNIQVDLSEADKMAAHPVQSRIAQGWAKVCAWAIFACIGIIALVLANQPHHLPSAAPGAGMFADLIPANQPHGLTASAPIPAVPAPAASARRPYSPVPTDAPVAALPPGFTLDLPPPAAPTPDALPAAQATPFDQGRADRSEWESWFAGLTGPYQEGAKWWAGLRSLKSPDTCNDKIWAHGADFMQGCLAAQSRLKPVDHRRLTEPDYKAGWNSH